VALLQQDRHGVDGRRLDRPLGVLVGIAAAPSEKWDVYSGERLRVGVAPVPKGGVGGSVSVRF